MAAETFRYDPLLMQERHELFALAPSAADTIITDGISVDPIETKRPEQLIVPNRKAAGGFSYGILDATGIPLQGALSMHAFRQAGGSGQTVSDNRGMFGDPILNRLFNLSSKGRAANSPVPIMQFTFAAGDSELPIKSAWILHPENHFYQPDEYPEARALEQELVGKVDDFIREEYAPYLPLMASGQGKPPRVTAPMRRWADFYNQHVLMSHSRGQPLLVNSQHLPVVENLFYDSKDRFGENSLLELLYRDNSQKSTDVRTLVSILSAPQQLVRYKHIKKHGEWRQRTLDLVLDDEQTAWDVVLHLLELGAVEAETEQIWVRGFKERAVKVDTGNWENIKLASAELLVGPIQKFPDDPERIRSITARRNLLGGLAADAAMFNHDGRRSLFHVASRLNTGNQFTS